MAKIVLSIFVCTFSMCYAYEQFLTFYSQPNFKGDSLTFKSRQADITNFTHFITNSRSYQARGYWQLFESIQYAGRIISRGFSDVLVGGGFIPGFGASVRHAGLLETSQQSISFYSVRPLRGLEKIITTPASNDITFTSESIISTGFSNWTFFSGSNFDGLATCFTSTKEVHYLYSLNPTLSNVRSVIRGCLGRLDTYLFAKDLEVPQNKSQHFLLNE